MLLASSVHDYIMRLGALPNLEFKFQINCFEFVAFWFRRLYPGSHFKLRKWHLEIEIQVSGVGSHPLSTEHSNGRIS